MLPRFRSKINTPTLKYTIEPKSKSSWLAVLVGVLLCFLVIVLWFVLYTKQHNDYSKLIALEANKFSGYIQADLRNRIPYLKHLVTHWDYHKGISKDEFINDIQSYISDTPGFQAIEWVDKTYHARWIVPISGNEQAQDIYLAFEENRRNALEKAKIRGIPTMTSPIELVQGGKGFLVYFPLFNNGEFDGFILAVFRVNEWLEYVFNIKNIPEEREFFKLSISIDDSLVFRDTGWESHKSSIEATVITDLMDHHFSIQLRPTELFFERNSTIVNEVIIFGGILLSLIVSFMVYLSQKATEETWRSHAAQKLLETTIDALEKTKNKLQSTNIRLNLATESGNIGIWSWDIKTNNLIWNDIMYELYEASRDVLPNYDTWRKCLHPEDAVETISMLDDAVIGKAVFDTEFRIILRDGSIRHIRAVAKVERDEKGTSQRVTGLNWNVTELKQKEYSLIQSEERVRLLLNSTGEAIYGINFQGECTFANPSCARMLGYNSPEDLLGKNMHNLIHHSYSDGRPMPVSECRIFRAFRLGKGEHIEESLWKSDGTSFPAELWSYPQVLNGLVEGAVVTFIDITERKKAAELLATEKRRLSYTLEGTNAGTWEWNVQTGEVIINNRWAEIIGYTLEELTPISIDTWKKYAHPDDLIKSYELLQNHFMNKVEYYECEIRMHHKNGNWVWIVDKGQIAIRTDDGKPLVMYGTHQDINARKQAENRIRHLASHDAVTDLPNVMLARLRAKKAIHNAQQNNKSITIILLNLMDLSKVNINYGHDMGDAVLKKVAEILTSSLSQTDTISRTGGGDFLIILPEIQSSNNANIIATNIINIFSKSLPINHTDIRISISIGIAIYPIHGKDFESLCKQAYAAMYSIKKTDRSGFAFAGDQFN